jgi:DNA-binding CsgD family transcriptional regulator
VLHGRDVERARLAALVASARAGRAAVLVILGDPGVGKSALLDDLVASAEADQERPAVRVLTTTGVAPEAPLPFATLHRLLRPALAWDRLPPPQARALRVAFGHEDGGGAHVEPFLVGVATLSVLTEAADDRPVLCVVDDAHWLDVASANALLFAARQLQADRVAMVFAGRDGDAGAGGFRPDSLPVMHVAGLEPTAARRLLAQRGGQLPSDEVADRLLAETGGNPLALLELPTGLRSDRLSGIVPLPSRLALTARVERAFLDRTRRASPEVQALLLVAAADDTGRAGVVHRATISFGVDSTAWDEAERSGLLTVLDDQVTVRHPLVRSAVYQSATSLERRRAHAALAQALGDDPDRQTWHRALATSGPDPAVADALHGVAERAERGGAYKAAADAFDRGAALTVADTERGTRLFAAARNAWSAGDAARASALCASARALADDRLLRADIERLRGRIEFNVGSANDAHRILTGAAEQVAAHDAVRALEMAVAAGVAQSHGVDSGGRFYALMLSTARDKGDGMTVLYALQRLSFGQYMGGQWAALRNSSEEAVALGLSIGQRPSTAAPQAWLTLLAALQGRPDYDERLGAVEDLVGAHPPVGILAQPVEDLIRWAKGIRGLLGGAATEALHQFSQMRQPVLVSMAAQDRIEAAVHGDDRDQAEKWVEDLDAFGADTGLPWVHATTAFGRALTSDHDGGDATRVTELFETSLSHHASANRPYDRARVQLAYGQFLRRSQRRVDARAPLRAALHTLEDLHAEPFADRARQELRASGETARKRDPSTLLNLTPMERKVAELVGLGLSNKDVAAQCWVSPRTVAFHLRNVFTKRGISSRGELARLDLG